MGYSFRLAARVAHTSLCYTSRGALAGMRNSSMDPPWRMDHHIAPWANTELHLTHKLNTPQHASIDFKMFKQNLIISTCPPPRHLPHPPTNWLVSSNAYNRCIYEQKNYTTSPTQNTAITIRKPCLTFLLANDHNWLSPWQQSLLLVTLVDPVFLDDDSFALHLVVFRCVGKRTSETDKNNYTFSVNRMMKCYGYSNTGGTVIYQNVLSIFLLMLDVWKGYIP